VIVGLDASLMVRRGFHHIWTISRRRWRRAVVGAPPGRGVVDVAFSTTTPRRRVDRKRKLEGRGMRRGGEEAAVERQQRAIVQEELDERKNAAAA